MRQPAVGTAIGDGQDRFAAIFGGNLREARRDEIERLGPRHAAEAAFALATRPYGRIEETVFTVDASIEPPDLPADESVGRRRYAAAVDLDDSSLFDVDGERAGVGAVERARRLNG